MSNAQCEGGAEVIVNSGHWRSSNVSDKIYQCFNGLACL